MYTNTHISTDTDTDTDTHTHTHTNTKLFVQVDKTTTTRHPTLGGKDVVIVVIRGCAIIVATDSSFLQMNEVHIAI